MPTILTSDDLHRMKEDVNQVQHTLSGSQLLGESGASSLQNKGSTGAPSRSRSRKVDAATLKAQKDAAAQELMYASKSKAIHHEICRNEERKKKSQEKSKKWPNTLMAQRQAKERERQRRIDREEERRQEIDEEERARQLQDRLDVLRRANELMESDTEKMKALRTQKMRSRAIDVR